MHFHCDYLHLPVMRALGLRNTVTTMHGRLDLDGYPGAIRNVSATRRWCPSPINSGGRCRTATGRAPCTTGCPRDVCRFEPHPRGDYLAFLGRISPEKRVDRAIEIARRAGMKLRIAAKVDAADREYFARGSSRCCTQPHVEFVGEIGEREKCDFLGQARALLFPIDWPEPFGLVMIEAMSCGTPCVAWRAGSVPEIINEGVSGFIVDSIDDAVAAVHRAACSSIGMRPCRVRAALLGGTHDARLPRHLSARGAKAASAKSPPEPRVRRSAGSRAEESRSRIYIAAHDSLVDEPPRTLKHGDTFALFDHYGDLASRRGNTLGLYHRTRAILSRLKLTIERRSPLLLSSTVRTNNAVLDVDLTNPDIQHGETLVLAKDTIHLTRMKFLWNAACYETAGGAQLRRADAHTLRIDFDFDADFADLFEVRGFQRRSRGKVTASVCAPNVARFDYASLDGVPRVTDVLLRSAARELTPRHASIRARAAAQGSVARSSMSRALLVGRRASPAPRVAAPCARRRRELRAATRRAAAIETSSSLINEVLCRSMADISMLVTDTEHGPYPYAGVPWFSTAFGRDGIITAMQLLWLYPAHGARRASLSRRVRRRSRGSGADAEPGKILHETRKGELAYVRRGAVRPLLRLHRLDAAVRGARRPVLAAHRRSRRRIDAIWPNILAALEWMDRYGDADGDGFVEYRRRLDSGLVNQGWKDSGDAVFHDDGRLADAPIALCEVQGYVYLARTLAARMAEARGEGALASRLSGTGAGAARAIRSDSSGTMSWACTCSRSTATRSHAACAPRTPDRCCSPASSRADRAAIMATTLASADFLTGWGIRTVSARERRFNPTSYHNGSIWPHDNALIALGLARYGHSDQAARLTATLFDAAAHMDLRRLPELFCGMRRRRDKGPILYPVACSPQAWAAAAPFAMLQACLGLEVDATQRVARLRYPRLPESLHTLDVRGMPIGDARVDLLLRRHGRRRLREHPQSRGRCGDRDAAEVICAGGCATSQAFAASLAASSSSCRDRRSRYHEPHRAMIPRVNFPLHKRHVSCSQRIDLAEPRPLSAPLSRRNQTHRWRGAATCAARSGQRRQC